MARGKKAERAKQTGEQEGKKKERSRKTEKSNENETVQT